MFHISTWIWKGFFNNYKFIGSSIWQYLSRIAQGIYVAIIILKIKCVTLDIRVYKFKHTVFIKILCVHNFTCNTADVYDSTLRRFVYNPRVLFAYRKDFLWNIINYVFLRFPSTPSHKINDPIHLLAQDDYRKIEL